MIKIKNSPFEQLKLAILYAYRSAPRLMVVRLFLMIFQSSLPLIPLYLIKLLVDGLGESEPNIQFLLYVVIGFGVIKMLLTIINNYAAYCTEVQGQEISNYMSKMVIDKAVALDYKNHENPEFNNSFHRARTEANTLPAAILSQLTVFVQNGLTMLALVTFLISMHWVMTLILVVSAIPVAIVKVHFSKEKWVLFFKNTNLRRKAEYFNYLLTSAHPARELHVFGFGKLLKNRFVRIIEELLEETKKLAFHGMRTITLVQIVDVLALVFALYFIMQTTLNKAITIGSMVMFYQGFVKAQGALANLFQSSISIYYKRLFFADFVDFMNIPERKVVAPEMPPIDRCTNRKFNALSIENLSFHYPSSTVNVLNDINISLPQKGLTAIVGQNGSGKSSLIKLICGLYEPIQGRILINGRPINNLTSQENISVLFQDFVQYEFNVGDNISIADPTSPKSNRKVQESLSQVNMKDFINDLSKGAETYLGKSLEEGAILSGGQWQRIALARALYKKASIYILDEPTSFIDPHHEQLLLKNIRQLANSKQVLLITHKLYNLKQVDHLIVMDKGRVVDQGSYHEVLSRCQLFAEMLDAQQVDFFV